MSRTGEALHRLARPLRGRSRAAWLATGLGLVALLLGGAAWLVRLGWLTTPLWVLGAWALALVAALALAWHARRRDAALAAAGLARALEASGAWRRGALTALLERAAPGTSAALLDAADRAQAEDVLRRGRDALAPVASTVQRQGMAGALCLALGLGLFVSAGPRHGPAAALWAPARAWRAVVAPVTLAASATTVDRGARVTLMAEAIGRRAATLWTRAPGEGWRPQPLAFDSTGRASVTVGPLESDLFARVTSGSRASDTVVVRVRTPAFLGTLTVTAHYPAYLGMEAEPVPTSGDTLLLPAGTRLETTGEATAELRDVRWTGVASDGAPLGQMPLAVTGRTLRGSFTPASSGEYRLVATTADGAPLAGDTVRLPIRVVPDSAPVVEIPVPGADTSAAADFRLPLVIDVRDDHGLASVVIETRRVSRAAGAEPVRRQAVALPPGRPDRAILGAALDLAALGLQPGDTLRYAAVALDAAPRPHAGRSREFVVRLATVGELRAAARQATTAIAQQLDSVTEQSRRVARQTEDLAREQRAGGSAGRNDSPAGTPPERAQERAQSLGYDQAKRAEAAAKDQQALVQQAEAVQKALEDLAKNAKAAGLTDSAFQRRLAEVQAQLQRALTPELRAKLAQLQRSLENLDAEQTKRALEDLARAQQALRQALERSRALFERAALEGDVASLRQEARDLTRDQQQWTDRVAAADSARAGAEERRLAQRADSLARALQRLAGDSARAAQLADAQRQQLQRAGDQAGQAAGRMQQASRAAQQGRRQEAQQLGREAAQRLQPVGDEVEQARQEMAQRWRDEIAQALEQTMSEASRLAERQLAIQQQLQRGASPQELRSDQAAVAEGVRKLAEKMQSTAGKNALVPPQIGQSLAGAEEQMKQSLDAMSSAGGSPRDAAERAGDAVDAMNTAAYQMMQARADVSGASSGSGLGEAMERMQRLAQQQSGLSRDASGLLPMAGGGQIGPQLQALGGRQRALAAELERMRGQGQLAGAGELAEEAKDLARQLEAGRLDRTTVERQQRLFRRMLDAGRTLQGQEEDSTERQSTTARGDSISIPPVLRARLLGDDDRPRVPSWDELQRLSPEERRLVVDYFRRLAERQAAAPAPAAAAGDSAR
ncbi:MAG TPA: hypothetical protein VFS40_09850 [Gemmatimonadales bacterium]|nr:hypothetical protein [Gemmatimonadales bacterium]